MAASVGVRRGGLESGINMTPMIDVLLVLLIIFMVIQADLQQGLSVHVPPPDTKQDAPLLDADQRLVLEVHPGGRYALNQQPLNGARLVEELAAVFANRPRKVLFVKGAEQLSYAEVIHAVDASRAAGVDVVGLVPRQ